ncbi:Phytosulfokine receptor 2, variant 3 [Trifolium repens]|nr:Phytosulfokine receptor 2, variant 3 [Trifolium repens]
MVLLRSFLLTLFQCCVLSLFFCLSLSLENGTKSCDPSDLSALKDFAGNLTNSSIVKAWSNDSVCCNWIGVVCGDNNGESVNRVTKLILSEMSLNGTISPSLAKLDQLNVLNLSFNHLEGELPSEFSKLKMLKFLDLSYNMLSGHVADKLSGLNSIQVLNISSNSFSGEFFHFVEFPHLLALNVSNNSFTGRFSSQLCNSSKNLHTLHLSSNHFDGNLEGLNNCSKSLQRLHLDSNSFSGLLPDSLYSMLSLEQLSLSANNFSGMLSNELSKLSSLKSLVVSANRFSGEIPNVFENFLQLEQFVAHANSFSGSLPSTLALCTKLRVLDLKNNSLSGSIDLNFTGLSNLCSLDLASNHFTGPLPSSLSNCHELKVLSLARNGLNGSIPESYANLSSLLFVSFSNNSLVNLSGALSVLQKCKNLTTLILTKNFRGEEIPQLVPSAGFESLMVLALGNCGLKSYIPSWLLKCKKLAVLDLSWNSLNGSIPSWIGEMDRLFYLDFSNNSLTGEIPKSLTELKGLVCSNCRRPNFASYAFIPLFVKRNTSASGLQYNQASSFPPSILLSNNMLNGSIWPEIGKLKALHVLDFSRNNISGTIPSSISEMENLETLDLSYNDLSGTIPPSFNNLTFLSKFSVAHNHLQGPIPSGGQFLSFPSSSFEGNLGLCRDIDIDSTRCKVVNDTRPNLPSGSSKKISRSSVVGITISIGVGLALLLSIIVLRMSKREEDKSIDNFDEEMNTRRSHRLSSEAFVSSKLVLFQNSDCKDLTVSDLLKATNNFNQANIVGCGGFGLVYKAYLPNGMKAAVKRLSGDCGTLGYIPPEYSQTLTATFRGDVYSFGVVLLELLTGRRPVEVIKGKNCRNLVSWVYQMKYEKKEQEIFDQAIWEKEREKQLLDVLGIACKCLDQDPRQRPSIEMVVSWLDNVRFDGIQQ